MKDFRVRNILAGKVSQNTINNYDTSWRLYVEFCGSVENALDPRNLTEWREYMIHVAESASGSINVRILGVKRIIRELCELGELDEGICEKFYRVRGLPHNALPERKRPHNRTRISPEQMREMIDATRVDLKNPILARDRAILLTLATSGMRSSEMCSVKVSDILDMGKGCVIDNIRVKGGRVRRVPISRECYEAIHDWLFMRPVQSEWVFTTERIHNPFVSERDTFIIWNDEPMNRTHVLNRVKKYADMVGIEHVKTHDFRRFVGTILARKNVRVAQKVLGHKNIAMTAENYLLDEVEPGTTENLF